MHELMKLKEMLMKELEEYGSKGELTSGSLEVVDKLSHAIKNICKIIEAYEDEEYSERGGGSYRYSGRYAREGGGNGGGGSNRGGNSSRYSGYDGGSYARGRGQNALRDSMGRYSRGSADEMIEQLEQLMQDAPNEQIKQSMERLVQQMEQM